MKILLTGAEGNLGRSLQNQGKDHQFYAFGRGNWKDLGPKLKEADVVIHAASDLLTPVWKDVQGVMASNLGSTVTLLHAMLEKPTAKLIFVSSCAVYGRSQVTDEATPPAPLSLNGVTKLLNEQMIAQFCEHHKIPYLILRLFNLFGGNDRFSIISHLKNSLSSGAEFKLANGGVSQRDFIHVDDAAAIILKLAQKFPAERTVNVGSGETTRILDIVEAFKAKHPALKIKNVERDEAEYSRADLNRLTKTIGPFQFRKVLDHIQNEI